MAALAALWLAAGEDTGGVEVGADAVLACLNAGVNTPVCPGGGGPGTGVLDVDMLMVEVNDIWCQ
jgi:hypothetical protein